MLRQPPRQQAQQVLPEVLRTLQAWAAQVLCRTQALRGQTDAAAAVAAAVLVGAPARQLGIMVVQAVRAPLAATVL